MDEKESGSWIISLLVIIRQAWDWTVDLVLSLVLSQPNYIMPPVQEKFMLYSGSRLAKAIRTRELTSCQVVSAFVERIKLVNPALNAVVDERFEKAIAEAEEVDAMLDKIKSDSAALEAFASKKPFLGVPFTSKESTAAKGMSFTFGMVSRMGAKAEEDSEIMRYLLESGAILLGVTNVPEMNLWCETRNYIYGQTNNPYVLCRTSGGSSGGEASIISACGSPMGIGTDIGGSTRMPAYYCGIFGHKPTPGLISTKGMTFRTGEEKHTIVAPGSLSRHVEDIEPFMRVLFSATPKDKMERLSLDTPVDVTKLKYRYITEPGDIRVSPVCSEVRACIQAAADHFATITPSGSVKKVSFEGFKHSASLWRHMMTKEPSSFSFDIGNRQKEVRLSRELPLKLIGQSKHTLPVILRLIDLHVLPSTDTQWADSVLERLVSEVEEELGPDGVLLFPSSPNAAPYHYASFLRPYNHAYWGVFNATMLPATQVPMGLSSTGCPIGLQVVARKYNDRLCWAVARELEKTFQGWVPPFTD